MGAQLTPGMAASDKTIPLLNNQPPPHLNNKRFFPVTGITESDKDNLLLITKSQLDNLDVVWHLQYLYNNSLYTYTCTQLIIKIRVTFTFENY